MQDHIIEILKFEWLCKKKVPVKKTKGKKATEEDYQHILECILKKPSEGRTITNKAKEHWRFL